MSQSCAPGGWPGGGLFSRCAMALTMSSTACMETAVSRSAGASSAACGLPSCRYSATASAGRPRPSHMAVCGERGA